MSATADVLMSSPPGPSRFNTYTISSSPRLPSLDEIFTKSPKKPPLKSGNHAVPIPGNARTTFTSAATILREAPEIDIDTEQVTNSPSPKPKSKAKASRGRKKVTATPPDTTNIPADTPILVESSPSQKPWQKFKSKEQDEREQAEQASIPKGRVTAAGAKNKTREKTETVSRHFASAKETSAQPVEEKADKGKPVPKQEAQSTKDTSYSEMATRRRDDWTPPPPSNNPIFLGSDSDNCELPSSIDGMATSKDVFQSLLADYGCKDASAPPPSGQLQQSEILRKRKRIEPVSTSNEDSREPSRAASPSKPIATKKKTRTITELATAPYLLPTESELELTGPTSKDSLLNYFDSDGAVKALVEHQTAVMSQKKDNNSKGTKAAAKPKRKKKSGTADKPILLSPDSALKQSSNQDFVFGTSSQLIREDSPTTIRELQTAIQASNRIDSDPFADSESQGLWHAGARDMDGDLMKVDIVEVIDDSPVLPRFRKQEHQSDQKFVDIHDILKSSDMDEPATRGSQPARAENSHFFQSQIVPSAQGSKASDPEPTQSAAPAAAAISNPRPNYELFTDAQLSKQIMSYGFKPVKKRQAMIALLDQCWASKNPGASTMQSNSITTSSAPKSPKRKQSATSPAPKQPAKPRGRPRKNSAAEKVSAPTAPVAKTASPKKTRGRPKKTQAVEIADSDLDESTSSSRTSSAERIFSSPSPSLPERLSASTCEDADVSLTLSPTEQQTQLFEYITRAVTGAPRSRDPARPSWHEKMLLFDPVILEDLTAWLNSGPLTRAGCDAEVAPADVKRWCESKSVTCLWRQNLQGKERKRY
ncbi:hypothetical protein F4779DRAFT_599517 [Xylariaceae sp. FL0662B]|nr:hypothetical protein F4779DRAFT_599517 [Xylariaceae sp. FL0662B]